MATATRVYVVKEEGVDKERLVRAINPAQAIRHVVRKKFSADVATQDALIRVLSSGATVEEASADPE